VIIRAELQARVREWGLTEEVVEKDYVLGWLLWGIGTHPALRRRTFDSRFLRCVQSTPAPGRWG